MNELYKNYERGSLLTAKKCQKCGEDFIIYSYQRYTRCEKCRKEPRMITQRVFCFRHPDEEIIIISDETGHFAYPCSSCLEETYRKAYRQGCEDERKHYRNN